MILINPCLDLRLLGHDIFITSQYAFCSICLQWIDLFGLLWGDEELDLGSGVLVRRRLREVGSDDTAVS